MVKLLFALVCIVAAFTSSLCFPVDETKQVVGQQSIDKPIVEVAPQVTKDGPKLTLPKIETKPGVKGRSLGSANPLAGLTSLSHNPFALLPEIHHKLEKLIKKLSSLPKKVIDQIIGKHHSGHHESHHHKEHHHEHPKPLPVLQKQNYSTKESSKGGKVSGSKYEPEI